MYYSRSKTKPKTKGGGKKKVSPKPMSDADLDKVAGGTQKPKEDPDGIS
ncbi:MAG: hypothetical protein K8L97_24785 [Anaerolineae bacterium]|nr:hypothetical protein [Anaerolineae bacterium]